MSNAAGPSSQSGAKVNNHQKASERMSEDESKFEFLSIKKGFINFSLNN